MVYKSLPQVFVLTVCSFSRLTCSSSTRLSLFPWSSCPLSSEHSPFSLVFSFCSIHSSDSFTMEEATAAGPGEGLRSPPLLPPSPVIIGRNNYFSLLLIILDEHSLLLQVLRKQAIIQLLLSLILIHFVNVVCF